uniref:Enoyl-CoA delta isomerase 2, mitochondrial n=1 Tax=Haemonchus contortus TaxID=6289 RepID=A0A7I4Z0C7_HAECO|nr:Crotonase domain containing protein [Haemonchus contortus]
MTNHILTEKVGNVFWIRFNRADKYNAITSEMYRALIAAFDEADNDDEVSVTVLTGSGAFYCAGSDFSATELQNSGWPSDSGTVAPYKLWTDRLILHSKLLVALVNGPAIGIACSTLGLCDVVLASDKAYFYCPFTTLGLNPEGCSSYTFVQLMGHIKAARLILLSEKLSAKEACEAGLISQVFPHESFSKEAERIVDQYSKLARQSLLVSKQLLRPESLVDKLLTVNRKECEVLMEQFRCDETLERMMSKFSSKI